MEKRQSKNVFDFLALSGERLKGKFWDALVGTVVFLTPFFLLIVLALSLSIKISWYFAFSAILLMVIWGPMEIGLIKFYNDLIDGKETSPFRVFSGFTSLEVWKVIYLGVVLILGYVLGTALLIFPLFIVISLFSMVFFFYEKHQYKSPVEGLKVCAKNMSNNIGNMFAYKAIFYFGYLILLGIAALVTYLLISWGTTHLIWAIIILCVAALLWLFVYAALTVYYHACNETFFEEVLDYEEKKRARKQAKAEEVKVEEVKEVKPVEVAKPVMVKKPTTAKKPVAQTKSTTAKKPVAKKAPAKPIEKPASIAKRATSAKKTTSK